MANEIEASELAVAKEDLTNEEILDGESSSAKGVSAEDVVADGTTENIKEVKLQVKAENEAMAEECGKLGSELTVTKEIVTEKVTELKETLNLTKEESDVTDKPDSCTVIEKIKESDLETKAEPLSEPVATVELKSADEVTPGPQAVANDKPADFDQPKPAVELMPEPQPFESNKPADADQPKLADELMPGPEPDESNKPADADQPKLADELMPGPEPDESDKPADADQPKLADELMPGPEPDESDKPADADQPKLADEVTPGLEPVVNDKPADIDQPKPADEVTPGFQPVASDKPIDTVQPVLADELTSGPEPVASYKQELSDEPVPVDKIQPGCNLESGDEQQTGSELEPNDEIEPGEELSAGLELEPGDEEIPDVEEEPESEDEEKKVQDVGNNEEKVEKPLDDDQDRRNPQYIPKGGAFYEHDNRTSLEDVENKDPQENEKKKKSWKESKDSEEWLHDCYNESEQQPKSTAEIIETYGYDIRRDDAPPRARRRRKYGRGPDKYERSWEDEQAYQIKQNNIGRRGRKKVIGKDEFPPLPNHKFNSSVSKPVHKSSIRRKEDGGSKSMNVKLNGNEKSPNTSQASRSGHSGNLNSQQNFNSNRKNYSNTNKKLNDSDIKPFRNDDNKWKTPFKHGRQDDFPKPIKTQSIRHTEPPFRRTMETNKNSTKEPHISHITEGINQMTFLNKQSEIRDVRLKSNGPEESKINEPEVDNPVNRQNPKRYSKIRKGFTGIFPSEEIPELDQSDIHKIQQEQQKSQHLNMTQPLNMQNVIKRYAGTYGNLSNCVSDFVPGNSSYLQARPIISGIPQQALSPQGIHQQALSPQGIPQQALSPQVPGLPTIELQQNPLAQPNFVPQPMYVDAHFPPDVMGPFSGYSPYSGNQTGDVYQPSRGITYYNTECQTSGQKHPPPRRQNAAIPIIPPQEKH